LLTVRFATPVALLFMALVASCHRQPAQKTCPDGLERDAARSKEGKELWCRSADGKRARWTEFHMDGKARKQTCGFADGKAQGSYLAWHRNGQLWMEGVYRDGSKEGKWILRNEDGALIANGEYQFGRFVAGAPVGTPATCETMTP
jgi:hypothetical protein